MSGLCKVGMSAFLGAGRGPNGRGADQLEPTREGAIESVARNGTRSSATKGSRGPLAAERAADPAVANPLATGRRPRADPSAARPEIQSQDLRGFAAARSTPVRPSLLCGLWSHAGVRAFSASGNPGEPRDSAEMDEPSRAVAAQATARESPSRLAAPPSGFWRVGYDG